jgi:hypothetical protein
MSSGSILLYFAPGAAPSLAVFEALFSGIGLRLEQPGSGRVFSIAAEGEQVPVTREWIEAQIAAENDVSVQWWYTDSEDVYCRFEPQVRDELWRVELGLDGVDHDRAEMLISVILDYFKKGDFVALVVDRTGQLEDAGT